MILRRVRRDNFTTPGMNLCARVGRLFQQQQPMQMRSRSRYRRDITILLDPGRFLNRLLVDLILILPRMAAASFDRGISR
jgi:hypothetical protein